VEDGVYDRYVDLSIGMVNTLNPALRKGLGLPMDDVGVLVASVASAGVCHGYLRPGDVLLSIDGLSVASDGTVELNGERVHMAEVAERKFRGESVAMEVWRDRKKTGVTVPFSRSWPFMMQSNQFDVQPTYVLFGGLLFQPLSRNLISSVQFQNLRVNYFYDAFTSREIYREHPEVIVLTSILADPINTYLGEFREGIVDSVNGRKVTTLRDMSEELSKPSEFYVFEFVGNGKPLVLEGLAVAAAKERIHSRYGVRAAENLDPERR
jgi:hypothetical protein